MNTEINIFGKKIAYSKIVNIIKKLAKIGLLLLIMISIFLLCKSVLLSPDDYNYTFVQGMSDGTKVDSISNIIQTGKYFYANWTGRVLPHVLIGIFRNIPSIFYEIINTIVFVIFIITIDKVLNKKTSFTGILSIFGYLVFSRMFGEKFAWISGSFNYLWPSTFLAIFIYYFYNYFIGEKDFDLKSKIAISLFAFVTGFMHENVAFVGGAFLCCICLFKIKDYIKFDKVKKITIAIIFIMFCLGAFATIFAPGNFTRVQRENVSLSANSLEFLQNYKDNKKVLEVVFISMIAVALSENYELFKNDNIKNIKKINLKIVKEEFIYFILPALIATIPMAFISYFPPRAFLAYEVMFMIVLSKNVTILIEKLKNYDIFVAIISIVMVLVIFGKYSPSTLAEINYIIPYKEKITNQYESAKMNGQKDVLVSKFEYMQWIHAEDEINISNFFPELNYKMPVNALISQFYGFDRVTAIGDDEYLIEIEVDTEGINPYTIIEKETGNPIQYMEYDNYLRYSIPKEKLGSYVLDGRKNNIGDKIINYTVRGIKENKIETTIDDLILK